MHNSLNEYLESICFFLDDALWAFVSPSHVDLFDISY